MKKYLVIVLLSLAFASCEGQTKSASAIPPQQFAEKLKSGSPQLIDVRTPGEFADQHIDGAQNIDWNGNDFEAAAAKLDRKRPVLVYCKIGGRSAQAAAKLSEMGFTEVYDLKGGILKWNSEMGAKSTGGITRAEYDKLISGEKTLVNFYAEWCEPCKKMKPYIATLESNVPGLKVVKIDADKNKALLSELKITDLPVLELHQNGKTVWQHKGFIGEAELKTKLQ